MSGSGRMRRNRRTQEPGRGEEREHGLYLGGASEGEEGKRTWGFVTGQHYDAVWANGVGGGPGEEAALRDSDGPRHSHAEYDLLKVNRRRCPQRARAGGPVSWGAIEAGSQQEEQPWLHGSKEGPGRSDIY